MGPSILLLALGLIQRLSKINMENMLFDSVISRSIFLEGVYKNKKDLYENSLKEVETLTKEEQILDKTEKALKFLVDKLAKKDLERLDKLITYGLSVVYPDRSISFKSEVTEFGNKMRINLNTIYNDNEVDPDSMSSISVIESFLLRVLCIAKLKKAPLLLLDETFAAVHDSCVDNVSQLIAEMASKLKMDIMLITHNPSFCDNADHSLIAKLVDNKLEIEEFNEETDNPLSKQIVTNSKK